MSSVLDQQRSAIEGELQALLSDSSVLEDADVRDLLAGRSCFDGLVFLTMADGLGDDARVLASDLVSIAAALELLALQTEVHRRAVERHRRRGIRPTHDVLLGDFLESRAFELIAAIGAEPDLVERALELVVEATRSVQEGRFVAETAGNTTDGIDVAAARQIGPLTGCAVELAALSTGTDDRDALCRAGCELGAQPPFSRTPRRAVESLSERCPPAAREPVHDRLTALCAARRERESVDPPA
jgi:geranylgeranyl pyrophosphate synthase